MSDAPYAGLVARHGLAPSHRLIVDRVPPATRVLDVGCATGYLARELIAKGCHVVGVESDPAAAEQARAVCEHVITGDLEAEETRAAIPRDLDAIVCGDVLEHLRDPWSALAFLRTCLRADGPRKAIISVPNIAHWTARRALLRGRFDYTDFGLLDRTHLRFFTRASAEELARRAGFDVLEAAPAPAPLPLESRVPALGRVRDRCARRYPELLALQFVLVLRG